jgi:hypothetical protein
MAGAETRNPASQAVRTGAAGASGGSKSEEAEFLMALSLYLPRATGHAGRNWHLSHDEGCQRVREPVLSPLLYKSEKRLVVNEKYRVGSRKCTDRIENAKCSKKFFGLPQAGLIK